jgi:phosphatidylinositol glycan class U
LWLLTGTGNANFFYAATMVHGLNSSLAVVDVMGAALRRDVKDKAKVLGEGESVQFTRA